MSGATPKCSAANILPVRPIPLWISSKISRMPCLSATARNSSKNPAEGTTIAALSPHRLHDNAGNLSSSRKGLAEQRILNGLHAFHRAGIRRLSISAAVTISVRDVMSALHDREKALFLGALRSGQCQRPHGPAVKSPEKSHELAPPGMITSHFQRRFHRLRAGVTEIDPLG